MIAARIAAGVAILAGVPAAQPAPAPPSTASLFASYVAWVRGTGQPTPIREVDLMSARADLARLAPGYLMPVEGLVTDFHGRCPAVTFKIGSATFTTDANTIFDELDCHQLLTGREARVFRQADPSLPIERIVSLPKTASSAKTPRPKPGVDDGRRRLLTSFAIELAAANASRQSAAAVKLTEWACEIERAHTPVDDFDRTWQLAALAVIEGSIDARALAAHLDHLRSVLPDEPRLALARAIVEEQSTAPAETLSSQVGLSDSLRATYLLARTNADHSTAAARAADLFRQAATSQSVRTESLLRLAHVQIQLNRFDDALGSLNGLESETSDLALIYLAHLFRGLAYDGLGRSAEARTAYLRALEVSPNAHSATMRLAVVAFRTGRRDDADRLLGQLMANDDPRRDPWWSYYAADWRLWYPRIDRVRALLKPAGALPAIAPATIARSVPIMARPTIVPVRAQSQVFRSRVDGVRIDVSVKSGNRPVAGLTAADFELRDNGVTQEISTVDTEQLPVDLTLLLDLSSSVDGTTLQRLKTAVRDTAALLKPGDRVRLIAVSQVLREVFRLQARDETMPLETLSAEGATSLYDGLAAAMMRPADSGRRQLVIAFSDGRDSTSIVDDATLKNVARLTDTVVDLVVPIASNAASGAQLNPLMVPTTPGGPVTRTPVYSGSSSDLAAQAQALKPWAQQASAPVLLADLVAPTTGQVFPLNPGESIASSFRRVLDEFRATYVLQYVPQGVPPEGWHDVVVTLKKPGKYDVRARSGYSGGGLEPGAAIVADATRGWSKIKGSELKR